MPDLSRRRPLAVLLGACLLAGCQPYWTGTISVDPKDPVVRSFKNFADAKRPNSAKDTSKPGRQRHRPSSDFQ